MTWLGKLLAAASVLAAMAGTAWAQEAEEQMPHYALSGRVLFGVAQYNEDNRNLGGPAVTVQSDLAGYWRDPRIFQYEVKPMLTVGQTLPGTEMGSAMSGVEAAGIILEGSQFPLNLSYVRSTSPFAQGSSSSTDLLQGVESSVTSQVLSIDWTLRLKHLPLIHVLYRDTGYNAGLPRQFGGEEDRSLRNLSIQGSYNFRGWRMEGWSQDADAQTMFPDLATGNVQNQNDSTTNKGFSLTKALPLHSNFGVDANRSETSYHYDDSVTNAKVSMVNASFVSQPTKRLSSSVIEQYTSNLQGLEVEKALSGAGTSAPGNSGPTSSTIPVSDLAAPLSVSTTTTAAAYRLGRGFSVDGSYGISRTSQSGSSQEFMGGLGYMHTWRTGWVASNYSYSRLATQSEVLSSSQAGGTATPPAQTELFMDNLNMNTVSATVNQSLPDEFNLAGTFHVSRGTLTQAGVQYPSHDYGGYASVTRPVRDWSLTGGYSLEKISADHQLVFSQSTSQSLSLAASYRRVNLSASRQFGSGLALQVGNGLIWVTSPVVITPLLGTPVLSSTTGTSLTGSFRTRQGRWAMLGNVGHFTYTTNQLPASDYTYYNLYCSYKLRRLRLIAGYMKQTQAFTTGSSGSYSTKLMYFQVERIFRAL